MKAMLMGARAAPFRIAALLTCLAAPVAQAATMPREPIASDDALNVRFDAQSRETRLAGRVSPGFCFSLSLPGEWRLQRNDGQTALDAVSFQARFEVRFRSAHELQDLPQPDLARRDAAYLQRDYEEVLGRPAQSVSLTSPVPGAARWSATWVDANLPTPSRAMTVEALIVPLSNHWVLELSLEDVGPQKIRDALIPRVLSDLRVRAGEDCRG